MPNKKQQSTTDNFNNSSARGFGEYNDSSKQCNIVTATFGGEQKFFSNGPSGEKGREVSQSNMSSKKQLLMQGATAPLTETPGEATKGAKDNGQEGPEKTENDSQSNNESIVNVVSQNTGLPNMMSQSKFKMSIQAIVSNSNELSLQNSKHNFGKIKDKG